MRDTSAKPLTKSRLPIAERRGTGYREQELPPSQEPHMTTPLRLGIAGLGTVGVGVVKIIRQKANLLAQRTGKPQ